MTKPSDLSTRDIMAEITYYVATETRFKHHIILSKRDKMQRLKDYNSSSSMTGRYLLEAYIE